MAETPNSPVLRAIPLMLIVAVLCPLACGTVVYVDDDAAGANDGTSWENAYLCLQAALAVAGHGDEIRVARGVYRPDQRLEVSQRFGPRVKQSGDRTDTFQLINGVTLKGGFAGLGEPDPDARNIGMSETILSGDLNGDDGPSFTNNAENSYHVVTGSGTDQTAVLDGFIITAGNANGPALYDRGSGMLNDRSSPTVIKCTFTGNCSDSGGAMNNDNSSPILANCTFSDNSAQRGGGAMTNWQSSPTLTNCAFSNNSAGWSGGAIDNHNNFTESSPTLINCTFSGNSAGWDGGGMFNVSSRPTVTNCVFIENSAEGRGGGVSNSDNSEPVLSNCIVWGNIAQSTSQIDNDDTSSVTITYSDVQGGWSDRGNINADPLFADAENGDYHLKSEAGRWDPVSRSWVKDNVSSPCIDAGDPGSPVAWEPFPHGGIVNMGAYGGRGQASKSGFNFTCGTSQCVFFSDESTVTQSGGIAGVHETYSIEGQFEVTVDCDAGTASFDRVDAELVRESPFLPTQDLRELFNMTALLGTVVDDTTVEFNGETTDGTGTKVFLRLTFVDDSVHLTGRTIPPPGSADFFIFELGAFAEKKYGGGTGEPNDPHLIYTAEQMNAIGANADDLDKHFRLMADIDLSVYQGDSFNIIGFCRTFWDTPFSGVFDGNGQKIANFGYTSTDADNIGLFGRVEGENAEIKNLGLINPSINVATRNAVGSLAGQLISGTISNCYAQGTSVSGGQWVGGLVGSNARNGTIANCYSTASVSGNDYVGGLVGQNDGQITNCYATASVSADVPGRAVGGLVGENWGTITNCYAAGRVSGPGWVGPLVGVNLGSVNNSFWDAETSGVQWDTVGMRKSTAEMMDPNTFLAAGWDFVGEFENGPNDDWAEPVGGGYPVFWWQLSPLPTLPTFSAGTGEPDDPYLIATPQELNRIGHNPRLMGAHFKLTNDIDLVGIDFFIIGDEPSPFTGVFDGNNKTIFRFSYACTGTYNTGLFGYVNGENAQIKDVGMIDPDVTAARGYEVGSLVGYLEKGSLSNCYVQDGSVSGRRFVGGLVGTNAGTLTGCHSSSSVWDGDTIGGLVGRNVLEGAITHCYSAGGVSGEHSVGALVGYNGVRATITYCYSVGSIGGDESVGGLVGFNAGIVTGCYSAGSVTGNVRVGGLVGDNSIGIIFVSYSSGAVSGAAEVGGLIGVGGGAPSSYWDIQTSGLSTSEGGAGKTTAEMQKASTFIGWGRDPVWTIDEGKDYPRLWWENMPGEVITTPSPFEAVAGAGTEMDPYLIYTARELNMIGQFPYAWDKQFKLMADIDLSEYTGEAFHIIGRYSWPFSGVFDGNGRKIEDFCYTSRATNAVGLLGLFTRVRGENAQIKNLGLFNPHVDGGTGVTVGALVGLLTGGGAVSNCYAEGGSVRGTDYVGGLVGENWGMITGCYASGSVSGEDWGIGGLAGINPGTITNCHASGSVSGTRNVGGLTGNSADAITNSYATGTVSGSELVGGLVGTSWGSITNCYATGSVSGDTHVGGLAGRNTRTITYCYSTGSVTGASDFGGLAGGGNGTVILSFWNTQTSGQAASDGGTPKTTAEMQTASTFLEAGWDFVDETANGTDDIWWILEGQDYPRLWWELIAEN